MWEMGAAVGGVFRILCQWQQVIYWKESVRSCEEGVWTLGGWTQEKNCVREFKQGNKRKKCGKEFRLKYRPSRSSGVRKIESCIRWLVGCIIYCVMHINMCHFSSQTHSKSKILLQCCLELCLCPKSVKYNLPTKKGSLVPSQIKKSLT